MLPTRTPPEAIELAWLANAFLDSAIVLAENQAGKESRGEPYGARVSRYLCHHGIELTLKAVLKELRVDYPRTHNLARLIGLCANADPTFSLSIPACLGPDPLEGDDLFGDFASQFFQGAAQRLRYPAEQTTKSEYESRAAASEDVLRQFVAVRRECLRPILRLTFGVGT